MGDAATEPSPGERLYREALEVLPGGISRNTVFRTPLPFYAEKAHGAYIRDIEGVERVDFANNMASLIHGHAYPPIVAAVIEQIAKGSAFTMATETEVRFAQLMCARTPGFDKIRFVNSGTEAVMAALKAARAFTGRGKIAKVEGAYHGTYDFAEISQTARPENWGSPDQPESVPVATGTPRGVLSDVVIIPFNDPERAISILNRHGRDVACVLVDPMPHRVGFIPATREFVAALHTWCRAHDALLVFDEVITYRSSVSGAQGWYDVAPDLTALGKMIGGGFPVGALAGRDEVMAVMDPRRKPLPLPHSGTFSANPVTMTAGLTAMKLYNRESVDRLNALAEYARQTVMDAIRTVDIPACVTGTASMFRLHLKEKEPTDYRSAFPSEKESGLIRQLIDELYNNGIMPTPTCSFILSTAMTEKEIEILGRALVSGFKCIKEQM